ncbi:hypothetical protein M1B35_01415 [Pseudomonas sp. MAFF 302046]|uniref:Lipoprotein n=1 Tax=Pseudomonas morbosilactucae TaxID=2938197 RepID=A0ABT0JAG1_9PSED|nr:hypothetical protein [Pseudomonas morbosilactucae]MCK9812841.1 hypothetical protein [Pseudomonas morbosilactucae]
MRRILALIMMLSLGGCETLTVAMTKKIEPQADEADVGILQVVATPEIENPLWGIGGSDLKKYCTAGDQAFVEAVWVPIVVNLAIKAGGAVASKYVKGVKEGSSRSTKFRAFVNSQTLKNASCLIAYRGPEVLMEGQVARKESEPNALVVMKVERYGKAMRLVPVYASARNSISLTKCTDNCGDAKLAEGKINIAVAVTGIAAIPNQLGDVKLQELGTATVTVKKVPLRKEVKKRTSVRVKTAEGEKEEEVVKPVGAPSDIIALPIDDVGVQLTVVMSEIGDAAGDPDVAEAEIQAAVESLSVGAEAELKAHYERKAEE